MKPKRPRTAQREALRAADKLTDARVRLAALEAGGTPERPRDVPSATMVESQALLARCLHCEDEFRLVDHEALHLGERSVRKVTLACKRCNKPRAIFFRITSALAN